VEGRVFVLTDTKHSVGVSPSAKATGAGGRVALVGQVPARAGGGGEGGWWT
jgi:hypothetical protein